MLEFIQLLNQRYQAVFARLKANDNRYGLYQQRIEQLYLTESFLRKGALLENSPDLPLQIAMIGPTQAGKSSLTNLITNASLAEVSPLAGYTIHPQGFCCQCNIDDNQALQHYFGRFQQLSLTELSKQRHDCYALADNLAESPLLPECVFWDTPDFDSIDSVDYREGVVRTIALADIVVLVVSKEKYADQSVWQLMESIQYLNQPTLICLNKMVEDSESLILNSLKEKWSAARSDPFPDVIPLYYQKQTHMPVWPADHQRVFFQLEKQLKKSKHKDYEIELVNQYWHQWLEPLVAEHEAHKIWEQLVEKTIENGLESYQRDFLNHPQHNDTFQNALIALLDLLEIPGLSKALTKTRRVLTWPVRKLFGIGRKKSRNELGQEEEILIQIGEHLLISFSDTLLAKIDSDTKLNQWWKNAYCQLREQREPLLESFQQSVRDYSNSFEQDIEQTANRLYNKLSEHPIILNSLRATRVSTDAAALAVMIQTGGIGAHDLVITPAMLSVTSLLTESVVGKYMNSIELELKQHQLETVKERLLIQAMRNKLMQLTENMADQSSFNIPFNLLEKADAQRNEKRHGIRLF